MENKNLGQDTRLSITRAAQAQGARDRTTTQAGRDRFPSAYCRCNVPGATSTPWPST